MKLMIAASAALCATVGVMYMPSFADVAPQEVFLSPPKEAHAGVW